MRRTLLIVVALLAVACSGDDDDSASEPIAEPEPVELTCPDPSVIAEEFPVGLPEQRDVDKGCSYSKQPAHEEDSYFGSSFDGYHWEREADARDWMACFSEKPKDSPPPCGKNGVVITATDELVVLRDSNPGTLDEQAKGGSVPPSMLHKVHVRSGRNICSVEVHHSPLDHKLDEDIEAAAEARAGKFCEQIAL